MSETEFELELVDDIPAPKRASLVGVERDTKLKQFVRALSGTNVGTKARFAQGVRSPNYGGDGAAERWPHIQFSSRQVGSETVEKDGQEVVVPLYDIFATHIDPSTRAPKRGRRAEVAGDPPSDGLLA